MPSLPWFTVTYPFFVGRHPALPPPILRHSALAALPLARPASSCTHASGHARQDGHASGRAAGQDKEGWQSLHLRPGELRHPDHRHDEYGGRSHALTPPLLPLDPSALLSPSASIGEVARDRAMTFNEHTPPCWRSHLRSKGLAPGRDAPVFHRGGGQEASRRITRRGNPTRSAMLVASAYPPPCQRC